MATGTGLSLPNFGYDPSAPPVFFPSSSGGGASVGGGGFSDNVGGLIGEAAPLITALFSPRNKELDATKAGAADLLAKGNQLFTGGQQLSEEGKAAIAPVLNYLKSVAGGDQAALDVATAPERRRVIDQYDTAKQSLLTGPRSGGTASAALGLEANKAGDLASLIAQARRSGVTDLGQLSQFIMSLAQGQKTAGVSTTANATELYNQLAQQTAQRQGGLGKAIGGTIAKALPLILGLF